ncbi:MAG: M14 family zinc carboxypeptidase, partial [Bacteroidota bacterium]
TTVLYYMIYLLENYGSDPEVTYLVDNRRLTFVPVLNPDGYVYNEEEDPNGGGLWRKNRRDNGDGSFGVDPNRNYGYEWARDDTGSSPMGSSETYRGPAPFSDPETASLRDFVESRDFKLAFNYHSFSDVLIHPWGYEVNALTPDSSRYSSYAALMTEANGYPSGTTGQMLGYVVNGSSDDWFYGEQATKDKIYAFTPEVGTFEDFFWPLPDRIEPLAQENLDANLLLAWVAGGYPDVRVVGVKETDRACPPCGDGFVDPGDFADVSVRVTNIGLDDLDEVALRLTSATDDFVPVGIGTVGSMPSDGSVEIVLQLEVSPDAPLGVAEGLAIELDLNGVIRTVPMNALTVGTPTVRFEDPAETVAAWIPRGGWGRELVAGDPAFSDSPNRDYSNNASVSLRLVEPLDLSDVEAALLTFRTQWDIEAGYDYGQVLVSTGGGAFEPLAGRFTKPGSEFTQPAVAGLPIYDGVQAAWVEETIDLSAYVGEPEVTLLFSLTSDGGVTGDGWLIDDVTVVELVDGTQVDAEGTPEVAALELGPPYPNPTVGGLTVPFAVPEATDVRVEVFDVLGRRVAVLADEARTAGTHVLTWDGRSTAGTMPVAGTYIVRLLTDDAVRTQRFVHVGR